MSSRATLFRKVALERLSSPEQLDHLVQVTDPRAWLAWAGLGGLLVAAVAWAFWGSQPVAMQGEGFLVGGGGRANAASAAPPEAGNLAPLTSVLYVPLAAASQVRLGMAVRVLPRAGGRGEHGGEHGALLGTVASILRLSVTPPGAPGRQRDAASRMPAAPRVLIRVALQLDRRDPSGYRWSPPGSAGLRLSSGTPVTAEILLARERPVRLLVAALRTRLDG